MTKKVLLLLLIFIADFLTAQSSDQPYWSVVTSMPYPVAAGRVVFNNDLLHKKFYILGGYSDYFQSAVDWIQEYDVLNNTWRGSAGRMKVERKNFVASLHDSIIVFWGGVDENSPDKDLLEGWNINQGGNSFELDRQPYFARNFATGHIVDSILFIIGGNVVPSQNTRNFIDYILGYNLNQKNISFTFDLQSTDKPQDHMTSYIGGVIYIMGGTYNGVKNWVNKFTVATRAFESASVTLLEPRAGGAAIYNSFLKKAFIIGGYNEKDKAMKTTEQLKVDGKGNVTISEYAPLNFARKYPMIVNAGNTIMVFGGFDENGKVVSSVEILNNPDKEYTSTDVTDKQVPHEFYLSQNYPNPFNPTTNIEFSLPAESRVSLKVYNVLGEEVSVLVNNEMPAGNHLVAFNAFNLASGVYFYRIEARGISAGSTQNFSAVKKMLLIR